MTGCKLTLSRKVRERAKVKNHHQRGNRTIRKTNTSSTDIKTNKNCGKPGHWAKDCLSPVGGDYDNSTYRNTGKSKSKHIGKEKDQHVDVVEREQPQLSDTPSTVSYPSQDIEELSCISSVDPWIMGVTVNSVSSGEKLVPSICFLTVAHNFTPVQSRIQDIRYRCLIQECTQQVEQDSNMTEDGW